MPAISRPSGWSPNSELIEEGEDVVAGRVLVHPDLVDDHRLLADQVALAEQRAQHELRHDLQAALDAASAGTLAL